MKAWSILGWTADADTWCDDCAESRYGPDTNGGTPCRCDDEGNEVHAIFASDEWASDFDPLVGATLTCAACDAELDTIGPLCPRDAIEYVTHNAPAYLQADAGSQRLYAVLGDGTMVECDTVLVVADDKGFDCRIESDQADVWIDYYTPAFGEPNPAIVVRREIDSPAVIVEG